MNQPFKSQQEIYEHLVKGRKIISTGSSDSIIGFKDGSLYNFTSKKPSVAWWFNVPQDWKPYTEPIKLEFKNVQVTHDGLRDGREALSFTFPTIPEVLEGKHFDVVMTEVVDD